MKTIYERKFSAPKKTILKETKELKYDITTPNAEVGSALIINLDKLAKKGDTVNLRIHYDTLKDARAFSWLSAEQTAGKKLPYLFTQCQAIACRSMAPMQDSPSVKATYSAQVTAPKEFNVKMSANDTSRVSLNETHHVHHFES